MKAECPDCKDGVIKKVNETEYCRYHTHQRDEAFCQIIWDKRKHVCAECGKTLQYISKSFFHHILPKAKFSEFRWTEENIILLCFFGLPNESGCHSKAESATSVVKMKVYEFMESVKKKLLADRYELYKK